MLPIFQLQCGVSVCEELNCEATRGSLTLSGSYTAEIQVWFFFFFNQLKITMGMVHILILLHIFKVN